MKIVVVPLAGKIVFLGAGASASENQILETDQSTTHLKKSICRDRLGHDPPLQINI
jgi:hypothetical protein